jgi:hypothetical protein
MTTPKQMMPNAKFYTARRDTRWDVYPQAQPETVVAFDWYGFWEKSNHGFWFLTPASFKLMKEITKQEAEKLTNNPLS